MLLWPGEVGVAIADGADLSRDRPGLLGVGVRCPLPRSQAVPGTGHLQGHVGVFSAAHRGGVGVCSDECLPSVRSSPALLD